MDTLPHDNFHDLTTLKLRELLEKTFARPRNITIDHYVLFSRKKKESKTEDSLTIVLQNTERTSRKLQF